MKFLGGLALALALIVAPAYAQDEEECPNPKGLQLSQEELQATIEAHAQWIENRGLLDPTVPGRAILCKAELSEADLQDADLRRAQLQGANLSSAQLDGADLRGAQLQGADLTNARLRGATLWWARLQGATLVGARLHGADLTGAELQGAQLHSARLQDATLFGVELQDAQLFGAQLQGADLRGAQLQGADLRGAQLQGADLRGAQLQDAQLARTDLTGVFYAPIGVPNTYVEGIKSLHTVRVPYEEGEAMVSGLVQLRELLQRAGLRDGEREATYAIEYNRTHHALVDWRSRPGAAAEATLRILAFEWPVAYGLRPGRALLILVGFIGIFALVYLIPLSTTGRGGVYCVWPEGRLEARPSTAELVREAKVEPLRPRGWWGLKRLLRALQFSVLSAFHLGWRDLNVGSWLARIQAREYTLRATGWVRVVAGIQSLLSVYLLALWVLTYFGRPFQ